MVSHFKEQESLLQNPIFEALYCEEEHLDEVLGGGFGLREPDIVDFNEIHKPPFIFLSEHDLFWENDELVSLLTKEKNQTHLSYGEINSDGFFKMGRNESIKWILKVTAHYGFNAMTTILAVTYYDRFISSLCFQNDKPWTSQLAAVACLSIAAKVEETQVPLLLELQVEESKYLFEAKTIQRMELLVLSTLQWRVNLVTPLSLFDHFVRRFRLITNLRSEFLRGCESLILIIITDRRIAHFSPSIIAAAIMIHVIREIEPCVALDYQNQLMILLRTSKGKIDDCHKLIEELMDNHNHRLCRKRKRESIPCSPSGVIDAHFSSDTSNDSWAFLADSPSPDPLLKRSRARDQPMRLAPLSSVSIGVITRPH